MVFYQFQYQMSTELELNANENIILEFQLTNGDIFVCNPEFTHQLFPDQKLQLVKPLRSKISIKISCSNLLHALSIEGDTSRDTEYLSRRISPAIPNCDTVLEPFCNNRSPPGRVISSFTKVGEEYLLFNANHRDEGTCELLSRAEKIAMWFIETADSVEFKDDKWEILLLFKRPLRSTQSEKTLYSFVGYMTLYTFNNPLGKRARICQALVLPPFKRQGLGFYMMMNAYQLIKTRKDVTELTVEDPCEDFQRLRDVVDLEWGLSEGVLSWDKPPPKLSTDTIGEAAKLLKITTAQAQFILECNHYFVLNSNLFSRKKRSREADEKSQTVTDLYSDSLQLRAASSADDPQQAPVPVPVSPALEDQNSSNIREFRLVTKRRLLQSSPELRNLARPEMQRILEELYVERVGRIEEACRHLFRSKPFEERFRLSMPSSVS